MVRGVGFIVIDGDAAGIREYTDQAEAQDEAIRMYQRSGKTARIIVYAPIATLQPKLEADTELKMTKYGRTMLPPPPENSQPADPVAKDARVSTTGTRLD